jgi:hypothetical protein
MRDDAVVYDLGEVRLDSPETSDARRTLLGEAGRRLLAEEGRDLDPRADPAMSR